MNHNPERMICEKCASSFEIRFTIASRKRSGHCPGCAQLCREPGCLRYAQGVNDNGRRSCRAHGAPKYETITKGDGNRYRFGNR